MTGDDFLFQGSFSGNDDFVVSVGANVLFNAGGSNSIELQKAGNITATTNGGYIQLYAQAAGGGPGLVNIIGNTPSGFKPIFQVIHDPTGVAAPTYHIYSGAAWIADL